MILRFPRNLVQLLDRESLRPDLGRACRVTAAIMVPLVLTGLGWLPLATPFVVVPAQAMAMLDVRGPYPLRVGFLLTMALVLAGAAALGTLAAHQPAMAVAAAVVIAANAGLWRHLTPEYGPGLGIPTGLLFFLAMSTPLEGNHVVAVLVGALWGLMVQVVLWPIRAQHPLRRELAAPWVALGALLDDLAAQPPYGPDRERRLAARAADVRTALDSAGRVLGQAGKWPMIPKLEAVRVAAARIVMRLTALHTAVEALDATGANEDRTRAPLREAYESLAEAVRSAALAIVSRQPAHLAICDVRLRRSVSLLRALRVRLEERADLSPAEGHVVEVLRLLEEQLAEAGRALEAITERAEERALFPMELFDLGTWRLRPLATAMNLRARIDPTILGYAARMAVLLGLAVAVLRLYPTPHGYWLPLTILVISQPDYGTTRKRAVQRTLGTLAGSILASLLLFLPLSWVVDVALVGVTGFLFAFWLRRWYPMAALLVTVMVVLLTESFHPATMDVAAERLAATAVGGAAAIVGAQLLWPRWERRRHGSFAAQSLRATADYVEVTMARLATGGAYTADDVSAKQRAEKAMAAAFGSLTRLYADPVNQRSGAEQAAVVANANQRLIWIFNLLLLHSSDTSPPLAEPAWREWAKCFADHLRRLADAFDGKAGNSWAQAAPCPPPEVPEAASDDRAPRVTPLLQRAQLQLDAMVLSARPLLAGGAEGAAGGNGDGEKETSPRTAVHGLG